MKLGIIGAGKAGSSLGKYLKDAGISLVGFYDRSLEEARDSGDFVKTRAFERKEDLIKESDLLLLSVVDGAISQVWEEIKELDLVGKILFHISGSLSSQVFEGAKERGVEVASIHPAYAFSSKRESYKGLASCAMTLEGSERARKVLGQLFRNLGHPVYEIQREEKVLYHGACVFASNLINALLGDAFLLLAKCSFSEEEARNLLKNLALGNMNRVFEAGLKESLTGPVERNDISTIEKHLKEISKIETEADRKQLLRDYLALTDSLIRISQEKHPQENYQNMRELLGLFS